MASHPRVRKVSFTGSIPTGKKIQELAAKSNLKRVTLELGGKSPAVVFDDCDLENAIKWATENLVNNTGQICFAATRLLIQESISEKFLAKYKQVLADQAKKVGDPDLESTSLGPLVDRAQFDRVQGFVDRERQRNKPPVIGGGRVGDKVTRTPRIIQLPDHYTKSYRDISSSPRCLSTQLTTPKSAQRKYLVRSLWSIPSKLKKRWWTAVVTLNMV